MIYFDNASTTLPLGTPQPFYNPSSPHALGINAERALRDARSKLAAALRLAGKPSAKTALVTGAIPSPEEIIFTSGGTESNNLAILGYALAKQRHGANLLSSPYEHPSILSPIKFAFEREWAKPDSAAVLFSVSHVNHETGDINDISAIAANIRSEYPSAAIHVDGAQGFCKELICFHDIDMYTFSGHKIHGPVGAGGLWVKNKIRLTPLQYGGGQETGLRAGTENVPGIVQMAESACNLSRNLSSNHAHVSRLKAIMLGLCGSPDVVVNALSGNVSPYILNLSFLGIKGEVLVHALSEKGVYVSMGAACNSRKRTGSSLELMGFAPEIAQSAIRFSFSPYNTANEAEQACGIIEDTVKQLRKAI